MVVADDGIGTAVEVTTADTVLTPGEGFPPVENFDITVPTEEHEAKFVQSGSMPEFVATHLNVNTDLSVEEVKEIAEREGWRCFVANRGEGLFQLIELWIENRFMVEVMQPQGYADWLQIPLPARRQPKRALETVA